MEESFELPVTYKGKEYAFDAQLLQTGYTHKFVVDVNGQEIFFEPDEERNYRAIINAEETEGKKTIDIDLLKAVAETIEAIVNG